jgi:hypothetical protein
MPIVITTLLKPKNVDIVIWLASETMLESHPTDCFQGLLLVTIFLVGSKTRIDGHMIYLKD